MLNQADSYCHSLVNQPSSSESQQQTQMKRANRGKIEKSGSCFRCIGSRRYDHRHRFHQRKNHACYWWHIQRSPPKSKSEMLTDTPTDRQAGRQADMRWTDKTTANGGQLQRSQNFLTAVVFCWGCNNLTAVSLTSLSSTRRQSICPAFQHFKTTLAVDFVRLKDNGEGEDRIRFRSEHGTNIAVWRTKVAKAAAQLQLSRLQRLLLQQGQIARAWAFDMSDAGENQAVATTTEYFPSNCHTFFFSLRFFLSHFSDCSP